MEKYKLFLVIIIATDCFNNSKREGPCKLKVIEALFLLLEKTWMEIETIRTMF